MQRKYRALLNIELFITPSLSLPSLSSGLDDDLHYEGQGGEGKSCSPEEEREVEVLQSQGLIPFIILLLLLVSHFAQ